MCFWNGDPRSPTQTQRTTIFTPQSEGNLVKNCLARLSSVICIYCHDKVWGTVQTWDNFYPLCFTDSGNAVQQSTSQIFGKSRRWQRYRGATRVFIYHRPAVLIAEQFHIFLINCWVTEIPQIIFCQSNSDVFGVENTRGFLKEEQNSTCKLQLLSHPTFFWKYVVLNSSQRVTFTTDSYELETEIKRNRFLLGPSYVTLTIQGSTPAPQPAWIL